MDHESQPKTTSSANVSFKVNGFTIWCLNSLHEHWLITGPVAVSFLADTMNLQYSYSTAKRTRDFFEMIVRYINVLLLLLLLLPWCSRWNAIRCSPGWRQTNASATLHKGTAFRTGISRQRLHAALQLAILRHRPQATGLDNRWQCSADNAEPSSSFDERQLAAPSSVQCCSHGSILPTRRELRSRITRVLPTCKIHTYSCNGVPPFYIGKGCDLYSALSHITHSLTHCCA